MAIRIFTVPFDPQTGGFPDEDLQKFLLNKKLKSLHPQFFQLDETAFWTVFVEYETIISPTTAEPDGLNASERLLYQRLREWRKETAEKEGVPVFIISTNKQLVDIVKKAPTTLEALRNIHGFGKKKLERYGSSLTEMIEAFNEKKPLHGPKSAEGKPGKKVVKPHA